MSAVAVRPGPAGAHDRHHAAGLELGLEDRQAARLVDEPQRRVLRVMPAGVAQRPDVPVGHPVRDEARASAVLENPGTLARGEIRTSTSSWTPARCSTPTKSPTPRPPYPIVTSTGPSSGPTLGTSPSSRAWTAPTRLPRGRGGRRSRPRRACSAAPSPRPWPAASGPGARPRGAARPAPPCGAPCRRARYAR